MYNFTAPGNDSFMVDCCVLVHNTLNSVVHKTELLLRTNGKKLVRTAIGEFTDAHMDVMFQDRPANLESHPHDAALGWLREGVEVLSLVEVLSCGGQDRVVPRGGGHAPPGGQRGRQ